MFHVEQFNKLDSHIMEIADIFLVLGEKVQELQESGFTAFVSYFGHTNSFYFYCYDGVWSLNKPRVLNLYSLDFESIGDFIEAIQKQSNLLMLGR